MMIRVGGRMELGQAGIPPWGVPWGDRWHTEHRRLPARYVRREFNTLEGKAIRRATAFVCGLGFFDLYVNGRLIDDQRMQPALTGYDQARAVRDVRHHIAHHARRERHRRGAVQRTLLRAAVANPMPMQDYGFPKLLALVTGVRTASTHDRRLRRIVVAHDRRAASGEQRVRRRGVRRAAEQSAGTSPASRRGLGAGSIVSAPGGKLESQMIEPVRVTDVLRPKQLLEPKPGVWMVDFGQAFYGVVQFAAPVLPVRA